MDSKLKKMWPALATSLVAFTTVVNADYNSSQQNSMSQKNGGSQTQNMQNQNMVTNGMGPDMMITPNAYHTNTVFFSGEALFWWVREGGLEHTVQDANYTFVPPNLTGTGPVQISTFGAGEMMEPCVEWNAGFRLGLGYVFSRDGWDLDLWWTHYQNGHSNDCDDNDCDDCCSSSSLTYVPMWSDEIGNGQNNFTTEKPSAKWRVNLNIVDLELGRAFMTSKWLELRPFIGVRGAWTRESYKIEWDDIGDENGLVFSNGGGHTQTVSEDEVHMKNKWWGVGPKLGLNSRWGLGWGLSLYGNAAISLLYGKFKVHQTEEIDGVVAVGATRTPYEDFNVLNITNKWEIGRAVTDLALGIEWEHDFKGNWGLGFNFGWEQHLFFNANQFWRIQRTGDIFDGSLADTIQIFTHERGDLSFQGFTLGGRIYF